MKKDKNNLRPKIIYDFPKIESDFPEWNFIVETPQEKKQKIEIVKIIKRKINGTNRKSDTGLF
jgi:hypothetical protein